MAGTLVRTLLFNLHRLLFGIVLVFLASDLVVVDFDFDFDPSTRTLPTS